MKRTKTFILSIATVALIIVLLIMIYGLVRKCSINTDFAGYWASGRLLLNGSDPYAGEQILRLQQSLGRTREMPLIIYNFPWTLTFILPFSLSNYYLSSYFWTLFLLSLTFFCADRLWFIYGGLPQDRIWALIAALSFIPVVFALVYDQMVPLVLLGVVGFLYFEKKGNWWAAGAMAALIANKPHALYLFFIALVLWSMKHRHFSMLFGFAGTLFVATLIPLIYNPNIIHDYINDIVFNADKYQLLTTTVGTYLRLLFGFSKHWLQYLPMIAGLMWIIFYWSRYHNSWKWDQQMPILVFLSLITTFYCWPTDYMLMFTAVIQVVVLMRAHSGMLKMSIISFYALINIFSLVPIFISYTVWLLVSFWIVPLLFLNYMLAMKPLQSKVSPVVQR